MNWQIKFSKHSKKSLSKLDKQTQYAILSYLNKILSSNSPYSFGKSLTGNLSGLWRYRVGKYRIICDIQNDLLIIEIITIDKREKIYGY